MPGLSIGSAYARLGAQLDDDGFDRFDRRLEKAKRDGDHGATAHLKVDSTQATKGFDQYGKAVHQAAGHQDEFVRGSARVRTGLGSLFFGGAGVAAATAGVYGLAKGLKYAFDQYRQSDLIGRQTVQVIKSTGGEAGITAKEVGKLATAISNKTGIDDEAIQSTENLLLTFTGLRNEAGKGNDVFTQTTKLATDMSVALGQDAKSSAIQLGKALNDPVKGLTALSRVGVSFSAQQKEQIKTLVASGNTLGAQKVILKEVTKEFGGSAEAAATNGQRLKTTLGNVAESIGGVLAPAVDKGAGIVNKFVNQMQNGDGAGGKFAKTASNVAAVVGTTFGNVVKWVSGALTFLENNKSVQKFAAQVQHWLGVVIKAVQSLATSFSKTFKGVGPELETIVKGFLKVGAVVTGVVYAIAEKALPGVIKVIKSLAVVVRGVIDVIAGLFSGDFTRVWTGLKRIVGGALGAVVGVIQSATAPIGAAFKAIFHPLAGVVKAAFGGIKTILTDVFTFIAGGASTLLGIIGDVVDTASHIPIIGGKFKGLANDIHDAQHSIDNYRNSLKKTNDEHERTDKRVDAARDRVNKLKDKLRDLDKGTDDYRSTASKLRTAQDKLNTALSNARSAGSRGAQGISKLGDAASDADNSVAASASDIATNVNNLAKSLGSKGIKFTPAHTAAGRRIQNNAFGSLGDNTSGFERGGYLGAAGLRGPDSELVLAAPGEAFLTHHQQGPVEDALAFAHAMGLPVPPSLDGVFGDRRSHQFASGGRFRGRRFFGGGRLGGGFTPAAGTDYRSGVEPEIAARLQRLAVALGLRLIGISGARTPQHSVEVGGFANDPHTRGQASDTPGIEGVSEAVLERYGLTRPFPGAAEADHIQLLGSGGGGVGGLTGALGGALAGASIAGGIISGPGGAFKSIAQAASKRMVGQANAKYGGLGAGGGGGRASGGQYSKAQLAALWVRNGGSPAAAGIAAAIALAESGGNPNATNRNTNGTIDRGLWQINSIHGALSVFDPDANARAAIRISNNGSNWTPWVTYNTGAYKRFARGGRLGAAIGRFFRGGRVAGGVQHFSGGGGVLGNILHSVRQTIASPNALGQAAYRAPAYIGLRRLQSDRIGAYDSLLTDVDDLNTRYSIADRKYSLSEEELIKDDGTIDQAAIDKRATELGNLAIIRQSIVNRLVQARTVTGRVLGTYRELIKRLKASRKHTPGKTRVGLTNTIKAYQGRIKEWDGTRKELTNDKIPNAKLDVDEVLQERAGVLGTTATPADTSSQDTNAPDTSTSDTSPDAAPAPPTAEDIAQGVADALTAFGQSRSDLFAQFGSNFATGYVQGDETALAAGVRNYGATGAGDAFGGGAYNPVDAAGGQTKPAVNIVNNYAAPPPDPHTWSNDLGFELAATL